MSIIFSLYDDVDPVGSGESGQQIPPLDDDNRRLCFL